MKMEMRMFLVAFLVHFCTSGTVLGDVSKIGDGFMENTFRVNYYKNLYFVSNESDKNGGLKNYSLVHSAVNSEVQKGGSINNYSNNTISIHNSVDLSGDQEFTIVIHSTNTTLHENAEKSPSEATNGTNEDGRYHLSNKPD